MRIGVRFGHTSVAIEEARGESETPGHTGQETLLDAEQAEHCQ